MSCAVEDVAGKRAKVEENGEGEGEGEERAVGVEDARRLVEHLSDEEQREVVREAMVRHGDVLEQVRRHADRDPMHRKIFVRGLSWSTSRDTLLSVFSRTGEVEEAAIVMDKTTGKSRGFGFVTFKHLDGALASLRQPSKLIDGRMTVCQLASTGHPANQPPPPDLAARKIFVGNVPLDLPPERLLNFFAQYGEVEEGPLGLDKQAGKPRGFALFIYKTPEAAKCALEEPVKDLDGHQMYCKLAVEGLKQKFGAGHYQFDGSEAPAFGQPRPLPFPPARLPHPAMPQAMTMSGGPSFNQTHVNPFFNPGFNLAFDSSTNFNMLPNSSDPRQNLGTSNSSMQTPLPQAISSGVNQAYPTINQQQTPMSYGNYAGLSSSGLPGPDGSAYAGQPAPYYGGSVYGMSQSSQTTTMQGASQYQTPSYPNQPGGAPSVQPGPTAGPVHSANPYYGA